MRVPAFVLGAAMLLVASTGCSSENEAVEASTTAPGVTSSVTSVPDEPPTEFDRSLPEGAEPQVLGPLGETEAEFTTDDGVVQVGAAEVPASVDPSFPLPADLLVQIASSTGSDAGFSGVSAQSFADLVDFYESALPAAGYIADRSQFVDGVVAVLDFDGPDGSGQVAISGAPGGGQSILVTFTG